MSVIKKVFRRFRKLIFTILAIGLPLFIYLGFIRREPLFPPEYDIQLGQQSVQSIENDSIQTPLLPFEKYPDSYAFIQNMVKEITSSRHIEYGDIYKYDSVRIINRDDVLNAFCTPGGYIYVYTGLIKYLDHPDHLAGVLGHEIAHAELRHSAIRLQKEFGQDKISDFVLFSGAGISGFIKARIISEALTLDYSRDQEAVADEMSVLYLSDSPYACNGVSGFFEKLISTGDEVQIPEILSDHPNSKNRIDAINSKIHSLNCSTQLSDQQEWIEFKKSLPLN